MERVQETERFWNLLVYGESGIGKTTLAGSADAVPSMRKVLFIDIEGGTNSLVHSYPQVETVRVTSWKEMQDVYNALFNGEGDYRTVVLDSLTEIQKFNMYHVMAKAAQERNNVDPDVPSQRDWGVSGEQIRRMVRGFRDLPMNTIFTALAKEDRDQKTGLTTIKPSLPGKLASEIAAFLDVVVYYYMRQVEVDGEAETKRLLLTQKTPTTVAKDRSGRLPQVIEAPTMKTLNQLMFETNQEKAS